METEDLADHGDGLRLVDDEARDGVRLLVGQDPKMRRLYALLDDIAAPLLNALGGERKADAIAPLPRRLSRLAESLAALSQEAAAQRVPR